VVNSAVATYGLKRDFFKILDAKIFYAFFSRPIDEYGVQRGFYLDLPWLDSRVDGYISDNCIMAQALYLEGIERERVDVLPIPLESDLRYRVPIGGQDILWCSRMDPEKRPELLLEIAKLCPGLRFRVYGLPLLGDPNIAERLRAVKNIDYRGGFDTFSDVDCRGCAAFLYTSAYDGMPNVVLEAMQSGLPVVATGVGGVPEALDCGRGISLPVGAPPADYCRALDQLVGSLPRRLYHSVQAVNYTRKRHSFSEFSNRLAKVLARHGLGSN
jgi:glycosyltransferase involved in cell wall biosynthesis